MAQDSPLTWEQVVALVKPKFDDLRRRKTAGYLSPQEQSELENLAGLLEGAYLVGSSTFPEEQGAKARQLLELAKECIPHTSPADLDIKEIHINVYVGLGELPLADRHASELLQLIYDGVIAEGRKQQAYLRAVGWLRQAQKRNKEAAEFFVAAIKADPTSDVASELILDTAIAYLDAGLYAEAVPYLESDECKAEEPWFYQQFLAGAYERLGRWNDAIGVYKRLLDQYQDRKATIHFAFRVGFCEARRDNKRLRPTSAKAGSSFELTNPGQADRPVSDLTEHEKTRLLITRLEHRLRNLDQQVENKVIRPGYPYSNITKLRESLRACEEFIWWSDTHFRTEGLEVLAEVAEASRIRSIRILSREDMTNRRAREDWRRFEREMIGKGIQVEWRTTPEKVAHDRFIIGANVAFNVPPVRTIFKGDYSEILKTSNRPRFEFEEWWSEARPLS